MHCDMTSQLNVFYDCLFIGAMIGLRNDSNKSIETWIQEKQTFFLMEILKDNLTPLKPNSQLQIFENQISYKKLWF